MTLTAEHIETDTRERILEVAERLFRQLGYQKTTVGDIAKELDRKSTRLNSSHYSRSRMPSSA